MLQVLLRVEVIPSPVEADHGQAAAIPTIVEADHGQAAAITTLVEADHGQAAAIPTLVEVVAIQVIYFRAYKCTYMFVFN